MRIHVFSLAPIETPRRVFAGAAGRRPIGVLAMAVVLAGGWPARPASAEPSPPPAVPTSRTAIFPHGLFDDAPEPFLPKEPLGQADRDRREAAALFAAGRAHEQRHEDSQALRMYQRAPRLDPKAADIAESVVYLAYYSKEDEVALRYIKMTDPADDNPKLLRELGLYALRREDFSEAAKLLDRTLAAQKARRKTPSLSSCTWNSAASTICWKSIPRPPAISPSSCRRRLIPAASVCRRAT